MNVAERNLLYLKGPTGADGLFPHLDTASAHTFFGWYFGLPELPEEPGITKSFPREKLLVVSSERFEGAAIRGVTLEDFLLDEAL